MDDGYAQGWIAASCTRAVRGDIYHQSNATATNTNTYRSQSQSQMVVVRWKATYTSGTQAGIYLDASGATGAERGNSYRIWRDASSVKIYEVNSNAAMQTHAYASQRVTVRSRAKCMSGATACSWLESCSPSAAHRNGTA